MLIILAKVRETLLNIQDDKWRLNMVRIYTTAFLICSIGTVLLLIVYSVWTLQPQSSPASVVEGAAGPLTMDSAIICHDSYKNKSQEKTKTIFFVTPTYPRREQVAELTRLAHTLMHVSDLHWIIAEDNERCSELLSKLLQKFGIPYTHIASPMPSKYRQAKAKPKGVANRIAALQWIRDHVPDGILYFGDDDNTYDLKLFDEIRKTKVVSMFPVGLIGEYAVSSPIFEKGNLVGFFDPWPANRKYPVDMAGFAINIGFLNRRPNASMPFVPGYEETRFLASLNIKLTDIEPLASNCTEILVWHTKTQKKPSPVFKLKKLPSNSLGKLLVELVSLGMTEISNTKGVQPVYVTEKGKKQTLT